MIFFDSSVLSITALLNFLSSFIKYSLSSFSLSLNLNTVNLKPLFYNSSSLLPLLCKLLKSRYNQCFFVALASAVAFVYVVYAVFYMYYVYVVYCLRCPLLRGGVKRYSITYLLCFQARFVLPS